MNLYNYESCADGRCKSENCRIGIGMRAYMKNHECIYNSVFILSESTIKYFVQVWLCFFGSTAAFIAVTGIFYYLENNERNRPIWTFIYYQWEYVLTIITLQGFSFQVKLSMLLLKYLFHFFIFKFSI